MNEAMALVASHVHEFFDEAALSVHGKLERELGREVLSTQWTDLVCVLALMKTCAPAAAPTYAYT